MADFITPPDNDKELQSFFQELCRLVNKLLSYNFDGTVTTQNLYPATDDTYYLGKNDDDTPYAWKGVILKDQAGTGKYYRIEVSGDALQITDLTD
jgi:hypothetical protein